MTPRYLEDHPDYIRHVTQLPQLYPTAINIELTTYCNLRCIMCPKTSGIARTPANKKIDPDVLQRILTDVVPNIARIDLVGDGEILLEMDLLSQVLKSAKQHGVLVNGSTNAVLLNEAAASLIVNERMHDLNVSMDAALPSTFKEIRGADFHLVVENIRQLQRTKTEAGTHLPHLHFSMVGMNRNIAELPALVQLAHDIGAVSVTLQAMGEFAPVENQSIFLRNKALGRKYFHEARELGSQLGVLVDLWPSDQFQELELTHETPVGDSDVLRKDCDFPWDVPYFATDGSIRPCCAMPPMGSLARQSFDEIWNGNAYQNLRQTIKSTTPPGHCKACPGRGWFSPTICEPLIDVQKNSRQLGIGWYGVEQNSLGKHYRWMRERGTFFLQGNSAVLQMELETASETGTTREIQIDIDHYLKHRVILEPGEHRVVYVAMPTIEKNLHLVQVTGKPWRPVDTVPDSLDPRKLTVKLFETRLEGDPISVEFEYYVKLIGMYAPGTITANKDSVNIQLYWQVLNELPHDLKMFVHILPSPPLKLDALLPLSDLMRKFRRSQFQIDLPFPIPPSPEEVVRSEISIPIPKDVKTGTYIVLTGLYSEDHGRLRIHETALPTCRNAAVISRLELQR